MQYQEVEVKKALGWRIVHEIRLPSVVLPQGHELAETDIMLLKQMGITHLFASRFDDNDIDAQTALTILASKICGNGLAYTITDNGKCKIVAAEDGFLISSLERVAKFNRLSPFFILNIVEPYTYTKKGYEVAELELTLPGLSQNFIDDMLLRLSGNVELLSLQNNASLNIGLIYSNFYNSQEETRHFSNVIGRFIENFADFSFDFTKEYNCQHNIESLADALDDASHNNYDAIIILGGLPNAHPNDIIPSAMKHVVDNIANVSLPQINASDLILAQKKIQKIISLPYNYDEIDTSLIDSLIKETLLTEKLSEFDLKHRQNILLPTGGRLTSQEEQNKISSKSNKDKKKKGNVAAIVLAAGISSRAGRNKLMTEMKDERPLFMNAVEAAMKSDASPVYVITGYNADAMEEYWENIDVNVIYNPSYRDGIKTSINLGIKALPSFCDGVLLLPADMPNITPDDINKLISKFDASADKQVCLMTHKGIKHNPIIWSSSLFSVADIVPENSNIRPVFIEHADYTKNFEIKDKSHILDVNYPSDIDELFKD